MRTARRARRPATCSCSCPASARSGAPRRRCEGTLASDVDVVPLAGALSLAEQDRALAPSPPGRRRVVLSTDIAETSLTVAGVRVVVDSGLARAPRFDTRTGMTRLDDGHHEPGLGRPACRTRRPHSSPGVCYRLWSKVEHGTRQAHRTARDRRGRPRRAGARARRVGHADVDELAFMTAPPAKALRAGRELLAELGALDADGQSHRRRVAGCWRCRVHPRLAAMLVAEPSALGMRGGGAARRARRAARRAATSSRATSASGSGCSPGAVATTAPTGAPSSVSATAPPIWRAGSASASTPATIDADRAGAVAAPRLSRPARGASPPGPVPAPIRHRRLARPTAIRWRTRSSSSPPTSTAGATGARIRLAAGLDADEVARELGDQVDESVASSGIPNRDDLVERVERRLGRDAARRVGAARQRRAPPPRDAAGRARRRHGLAVLGWSTQRRSSLRERVSLPAPHGRRAVARLERRAR